MRVRRETALIRDLQAVGCGIISQISPGMVIVGSSIGRTHHTDELNANSVLEVPKHRLLNISEKFWSARSEILLDVIY